jgi:hypothetical protein
MRSLPKEVDHDALGRQGGCPAHGRTASLKTSDREALVGGRSGQNAIIRSPELSHCSRPRAREGVRFKVM